MDRSELKQTLAETRGTSRRAAAVSDFDIEINIPREPPASCAPTRYTRTRRGGMPFEG